MARQKRKQDTLNQEKKINWENNTTKVREREREREKERERQRERERERERERATVCNNLPRDEADAKVRSYLFWCLGAEGQRQLQQKRDLKYNLQQPKICFKYLSSFL